MIFTKHIIIHSMLKTHFIAEGGFYCDSELDAKRFSTDVEALDWIKSELSHTDIGHFHLRTFYTVS